MPGANGGVVCQMDIGEDRAIPADLHADVRYDMRCLCEGSGDHLCLCGQQ